MSGTLESLSVKWTIHLPFESTMSQSSKFYVGDRKWILECINIGYDINLHLITHDAPLYAPPLNVSVRVAGERNGHVFPELTQTTQDWIPQAGPIWTRKLSEMQAADPAFKPVCKLSFLVTFGQKTDENPNLCLEGLSEDLTKLLDPNSNPDVELHCEGHTTRAHKNFLCVRSPVLASMFQSDVVEGTTGVVNIPDMTNDTLQHFLRYLYTGKLDTLTFEAAMRLYEAGNRYAVTHLTSRCSKLLARNLTLENACEALVMADSHSDSDFMEAVIGFMVAEKVPISGDRWRDFYKSYPLLSNKVYDRFCKVLCKKES